MSNRLGYCIVSVSPVRSEQRDSSEMLTQLLFGEIVTIEEINAPWCKVETYSDNYSGFVDIKHVHLLSEKEKNRWLDGLSFEKTLQRKLETPWGIQTIYRGSFVPFGNQREFNIGADLFKFMGNFPEIHFTTPVELALEYLNTPYLWGGKSPFGIDCSGLTQTVYRFFNFNLPRDASQQVEYGMEVDFEDQKEGDLAYFTNKDGIVTHVGILNGKGSIIHASGAVRVDPFTKLGIIHAETGKLTHTLHLIKRM